MNTKKSSNKKKGKSAREIASASPRRLADAQSPSPWQPQTLSHLRALILQAHPDIIEEIKYRKPSNPAGVPTWSHIGLICTGETYKDKIKLTFAQGAALPDPAGLFNASLEGNTRRAIDLHEGDKLDERAFKALIRAAVELNASAGATEGRSRH